MSYKKGVFISNIANFDEIDRSASLAAQLKQIEDSIYGKVVSDRIGTEVAYQVLTVCKYFDLQVEVRVGVGYEYGGRGGMKIIIRPLNKQTEQYLLDEGLEVYLEEN